MQPTVGQQIRQARIEHHLSLEQVAQATHIKIHHLQALEDDALTNMASLAQARGFVRLVAGVVGIEAQPLLDLWEAGYFTQEPELPEIPEEEEPVDELEPIYVDEEPAIDTTTLKGKFDFVVTSAKKLVKPKPKLPEGPSPAQNLQLAEAEFAYTCREIGSQLQKQREMLSLSPDEIELHTHLKTRYIKALEEGRMDDLPSPVQGRGMLSNYAAFLNLDSNVILDNYGKALQVRREALTAVEQAPVKHSLSQTISANPASPSIRRLLTPDLVIGASLIVMMAVFIIWGVIKVITDTSLASSSNAPSISEVLLETPSLTSQVAGVDVTADSAGVQVPQETSGQPGADLTISPPAESTARLQLYVIAVESSFVRVRTDGSQVFNERVVVGNAYTFTANSTIELAAGNAAALRVVFNQEDLGLLGEVGQAVTMLFTDSGAVTPTPAVSPTPTRTPQPTLTLQPTPTPTVLTPSVTPYVP
ncbi:MAG TPA: RodZ domain-containing protein [Longilinea sp.]|nr:RodZ domain-containing protein [Longilinea sp.]